MNGPKVHLAGTGQSSSGDAFRFDEMMRLISLGCIGGFSGRPVAFAFRDFATDVISAIWALVASWCGAKEVAEVFSQVDVQRLRPRLHEVRVILVFQSRDNGRFANDLSWMIEQRRGRGLLPLPVILSQYHANLEDTPGATVVIRGGVGLSAAAGRWLLQATPNLSPFAIGTPDPSIVPNCSTLLKAVQAAASPTAPLTVTDLRLLEGLLTGYWLKQSVERSGKLSESSHAQASAYKGIRQLLQHPLLRKAGEPVDDLAHLMVHRANAYLRARSGQPSSSPAKVGARAGARSTIVKTDEIKSDDRPSSISFVELVNLGNHRSQEFKTISDFYRSNSKSLDEIGIRVGTHSTHARSPPARQGVSGDDTTGSVGWSFKQARTRFERLRQLKLIDARRTAANGPYEYLLPEELRTDQSQFSHLPEFEDVQKHLGLR